MGGETKKRDGIRLDPPTTPKSRDDEKKRERGKKNARQETGHARARTGSQTRVLADERVAVGALVHDVLAVVDAEGDETAAEHKAEDAEEQAD